MHRIRRALPADSCSACAKRSRSRSSRLTRGGQYRNTPADTQVPYLRTVFTFLGLTDVQFVYAEGLAMGPDAERNAIASAHEQIEEALAA
jgi:FMN-dependent NADH-azoreductase